MATTSVLSLRRSRRGGILTQTCLLPTIKGPIVGRAEEKCRQARPERTRPARGADVPGRPRIAIVGVGVTEVAERISDKSSIRLRVEACRRAVDDAGLPLRGVDGLVTAELSEPVDSAANPRHHMELAEILGLYEKSLCVTAPVGGAAPGYSIELARWALQSGRCEYVLAVAGKSGRMGGPSGGDAPVNRTSQLSTHYPDYEWPYGPLVATFYACLARRHMHLYGTTEDELASIPVAFRYHASLNPAAVRRGPLTVDDVLRSASVSTPLNALHCGMINDGAAAFLMTTEERGQELAQTPVFILGSGCGSSGYWSGFLAAGDVERG